MGKQSIPTSTEVVNFFRTFGSNETDAFYWFNLQDSRGWKDKNGEPISNWKQYAMIRIKDKPSPETKMKKQIKKTANILVAESIAMMYKQQTGKYTETYTKLLLAHIIAYREFHHISDDIQFAKLIDNLFNDVYDFELENVQSILEL